MAAMSFYFKEDDRRPYDGSKQDPDWTQKAQSPMSNKF